MYMVIGTRYLNICCRFKEKKEAQVIFLNLFTSCSSCKWKFVICPFVRQRNKRKLSVCKQT